MEMLVRSLLTRIWLTYKQLRFETIAIAVVCLGVAVAALIEAYRLNSVNVSMACLQSWQGALQYMGGSPSAEQIRCAPFVESFQSIQNSTDLNIVRLLLYLAPIVAGIVFGAPMVARELEQGTAPLSWSLSGSRRRWLLGKVLAGAVLLVPLMLVMGLAADVLQSAYSPGLNVYAAFENYLGRGIIDVFWALAAFAGTLALGTILSRTLPAVIVGLVVSLFAYVVWGPAMTHFVLHPLAVQQSDQNSYTGGWWSGTVDLPVYVEVYLDGKPYAGDINQWWQEHPPVAVAISPDPNATGDPNATPGQGGLIMTYQPPTDQPYYISYVIPGSQYWAITAFESGLLFLGTLFCLGIAFVWVERRRPY
jgi:hypothetical protein